MERIVDYFEHIPSLHRSLILIGGITLFWVIESAVPLFQFNYRKTHHAGINFFFTITTIVVNFVMAVLLLRTSDWTVQHGVGLVQWVNWPLWAEAIVGLLALDLIGAWLAHFTEHKVKWMWSFHLIHHTDTYVDTTTANRHHPGESVIRFGFTMLAVLVTGAPMWLVFMYQAFSVALSQFNHANIELPRWADRLLGLLIVTPNMHHVHHHYRLPVTNTNYGNIFPYWDRLFGTYHEMPGRDVQYGIDTHPDPREHSHIGRLLKIPFQPYRQPVSETKPEPERV
ncbi:sterol desaturase family protein [Spirosoma utsteinense]|uniref:Sterol desaturase/sphingolipid hydroxylase (Fatty acid hydroxylase superfamily) n=1 Tax=Spirosoma utsteinense TaxID=2585773 RepID=A0ABR6W7K2_9BACT|nr:sterol desaturase family protein [Spirosoma utsteinense]MBC3783906.1 sterol desaturase/sphingolipid hydroxylase (fatty acid hydroxylase superfamily) [Spirosoma utsteinense]MBC3792540.1 sterol desaturase/sphingolipid hydroxylase (fatty acid hydroxylase superfamily) [Spirosoma utsteinense]